MKSGKLVTRMEFLRGLIRIVMIAFLAFIAVSLGTRAVTGEQDCSGCPGNGVCSEGECGKYRRKQERRSKKEETKRRKNDE